MTHETFELAHKLEQTNTNEPNYILNTVNNFINSPISNKKKIKTLT